MLEADEARVAKVEALRRAYLSGVLDMSIGDEGPGLDRLLDDLFGGGGRGSRPRKRAQPVGRN